MIYDGMTHPHFSHLVLNSHGPNSLHIGVVVVAAALYPGRGPWGGGLNTSEAWRAGKAGTAHRSTHYLPMEQVEGVLV